MLRARRWVAPVLLGLCLFLGGSVQIAWHVALLQMAALAILAWSLLAPAVEETASNDSTPLKLAIAAAAIVAIQILPLPASVWSRLPGRDFVLDGFAALEIPQSYLPLSLAPSTTLETGFALLVPVAVFVAMIRQRAFSNSALVATFGLAASAGTLLGIVQAGSGRFYPYPESDFGVASGFFANPNHMGLLLMMTLPLVVGLAVEKWLRKKSRSGKWMPLAMVAGAAGVLVVAILINGSLAILGLAPIVLLACALLPSWDGRPLMKRMLQGALLVSMVATAGALLWASSHLPAGEESSFTTRGEIWEKTVRATADFFPAGTGLGTFEQVYAQYEDPQVVDRFYANHAHNDYLELALESGLLGIVLVILFFAWWCRASWRLWSRKGQSAVARGAVIATGAALAHSIVDFPLRTPALAAAFAAACGLMSVTKKLHRDKSDLRQSRHVLIH